VTGHGWRPASQEEIDALDPGQRIGRGIDYLGYLLFGNKPDMMGGENYGHQAPLAGIRGVGDAIGFAGDAVHNVFDWTTIKPVEIGATVLSHIPLGWVPGGADETFNEIGARLEQSDKNNPMNAELYGYWQKTKAMAEGDILGGGNIKADFNDEILRMYDDMQYDSTLGTTPDKYLAGKTVGSLGGALAHFIEGWWGLASNQSQLLLGQAGMFDPGGNTASFEDQYGKWQKMMYGTEFTTDSQHSIAVGDEQSVIFQQLYDGKISEDEARAKVAEISKGGRSRLEEIAARYDMGLETSDLEKQAVEAWKTGAWSKQHAEEWLVSHGTGITRNPVGQILGTVATDPLTWATLGLGGVSAVGKFGLATAEASNVTIQSMKGLTLAEKIAASSGNAVRIAKAIPDAQSTYKQIAMGLAAVQKSPAGPIARMSRGIVDPFAVYKPNAIDRTAMEIKNMVAVDGWQRAYGHGTVSEIEAIGRETGTTEKLRNAQASYAADRVDEMTAIAARNRMVDLGQGFDMMNPDHELNSVDNVVEPMARNYGDKDAATQAADHILERSKNTFTPEEEQNLVHRLGTTISGNINWGERITKMSHSLKSALHALTYKMFETDLHNAFNAVDNVAYDGDLPLRLGAAMDINSMDETMARAAVKDIEAILDDAARPDRIEAATNLWNDLSRQHDRMGNIGMAPGGEKQLRNLLREMTSDIEQGAFPKVWTEQELAHPALAPVRDALDRHSIPMTPEEIAAAKAQAAKTAEISFKRRAALETRRAELKDALRATLTKSGRVKKGMEEPNLAAQKALEDFQTMHPEAKARFDVQAERAAVDAAKLEDEAYLKGYEAAKRSRTGDLATAKERFAKNNPHNPDQNSLFEVGWKDAQGGKPFGEGLAAGGHGVDNLPPPGSMAPTLEETIKAAEDSVTGVKRLWKIGSRPDEAVAWGLKRDPNNGLPVPFRDPTVAHNFMAYPGKSRFSDTVRNFLGQIIGDTPAEVTARPVDSLEAFIKTSQDMVTGRRLVLNMQQRFERTMFAAGVPKPLIASIFKHAKEVAAMEKTSLRGLSAAEDSNLWTSIAKEIPRDLRLADGSALDVHTVMDHLLIAAEGDVRIMGLTSKFSQRMRNAMRAANIDPVNYSGQVSVTAYNKMRYALNPTFLIQRITDSVYYSILYGVQPVGLGALNESNAALKAITENLARTGRARDFAFDLPEYATRANWTDGVKTSLQQAGIDDRMLSKIANAPDVIIQNNMINLLHARLGDIVRGTLDNLATAIEKDATLIAGATPEQAYILRRSFADWRATYSANAGRVLSDNEVGFQYIKDMLSGWRRIGPIDPATGLIDMKPMLHEGAMMMPSDIGAIGSIMPDSLAKEIGAGYKSADELRRDVSGSMQRINGVLTHVEGEHDLAWLKEILTNKLNAHPDYVKRAMAYFSDTWDNYWYRLSLPIEKGGLDISEHYAKEAQQIISSLAQQRGMDPWEYLSGVMLINTGTDSLDTAVGRFITFLKKGEVAAEPSDWGAFFRSHLDPSAQDTLQAAYANAQDVAAEAARAPKVGDKFVRAEPDGREFEWHVYNIDPKTGDVALTTNPKGVGRLGHMTREEWDAMKGNPAAVAAATPNDVPVQPPLGFITNPHVVSSGHDIPIDMPRDGIYHVTVAKDAVMEQGFRGSNAGDVADAVIPTNPDIPQYKPGEAPLEPGMIRAYHYTNSEEALTSIRENGLQMQHAKGEQYQEPNQIWFSTSMPATDGKAFVEVHLKPEELTGSGGAYASDIATPEKAAEFAAHKNASGGNFAVVQDIPPERIVTYSEPWHHHYNTFVAEATTDPVEFEKQFGTFIHNDHWAKTPLGKATQIRLDELKAATPPQIVGIGSNGDFISRGRVSFVTNAVRAQAYHDRLLLAVRAARGEITDAEIADYFIPLYKKAYGDQYGERMAQVVPDSILHADTHTPEQLVVMVKGLDKGLIGGTGMGLTSAEGSVNVTGKMEDLLRVNPDQLGIINLAAKEGSVAKKGLDVGELTLMPNELRPMGVVGEAKGASKKYVVDPVDQTRHDAAMKAWEADQKRVADETVIHNDLMEQHQRALNAYENDVINWKRDMQEYSRLNNQYKYKLKPEYDAAVAANEAADAEHAAAMKAWKEDLKAWEAEQKAPVTGGKNDVPAEKLDEAKARYAEDKADYEAGWRASQRSKTYDLDAAETRYSATHPDKNNMFSAGWGDQASGNPKFHELGDPPKALEPARPRPERPEHPGYQEVPPQPIEPVKPEEPVHPGEPPARPQPKVDRPLPPKMMELKQDRPLPPSSNKFPPSPDFPGAEMVPVSQLEPYREVDRALMGRTAPAGEAAPGGTVGAAAGYNHAEYLQKMVDEIKTNGFKNMGPIEISYDPHTGTALITDGNHRLAAAKIAGVGDVPVVVKIAKRGPDAADTAVAPKGFTVQTKYRPEAPNEIPLYHGSPDTTLTHAAADPASRQFDNATSQFGAFSTPSRDEAAKYAGTTGRVYEAGSRPSNPYQMSRREFDYFQSPEKGPDGWVLDSSQWPARAEELKQEAIALREKLISEGYDGISIPGNRGNAPEMASFADVPLHPEGTLGLKMSDLLQARMTPQEFWDNGIIDMLAQRAKTGPHPNPDVEGALQKVAELTSRVLKDSKGAKNTRNTIRELGKAIPLTNPVPYNRTHALVQHLLATKIDAHGRDIFRLAEMQTQRTVLERSLNHPVFGIYPASYMWGKVLPETVKFYAKNPFAATYIINDVQRAIALQREFDPEFEDKMSSVDRSAGAYLADYLTPSLPWSDHSARMSPMVKDLMKGDLMNVLPDSLAMMGPKRWYDQVWRTMQEVPGAVESVVGSEDQQSAPAWADSLNSMAGAPPTQGANGGTLTDEQISGAVKAAGLAPILADDMSRLQDILLSGAPAGE
jgi:hypothetical protein